VRKIKIKTKNYQLVQGININNFLKIYNIPLIVSWLNKFNKYKITLYVKKIIKIEFFNLWKEGIANQYLYQYRIFSFLSGL